MDNKIKKYTTGFAQISNIVLMDNKLSLKAKGLYAYLFSKPDGWIFYRDKILSENKDNKASFQSGIKELVDAGYIKRYQLNEKGKFGGMIYEFVDPRELLSTKTPRTEKRSTAPRTENPRTENRSTNNTNVINTKDILNNKYLNTTIKEKNIKKRKDEKTTFQQGLSTELSTGVKNKKEVFIEDGFKINTSDRFFRNLKMLGKGVLAETENYFLTNEKNKTVTKMAIMRKAIEINNRRKKG